MSIKYSIAGYCRISVDEEMDRDNTSIENQKAIIADFVKRKFPDSTLDFYEDRDRSGYTFEQREGYQELRKKMLRLEYDILIIKDFSRFSRRNSKGLVELEDLRDAGMRIISIGDNIDYPTYDDWTAIQFRFLINEMPVTDTSKKVKSVIKRRQEEGKWICAVPYGYVMINNKTMQFEVDEPAAEVVRDVFDKYNSGWGYKKIANYLTDKHIPTPRMCEKMRREAKGEECKREVKQTWSIITVSEILQNDFYIGTLRQGKYRRKKINGGEVKQDETDHIVFENNHTPIVDYKVFALAQEQLKKRTTSHYRGVKKYDNVYSGYLFCGDCGSPMFAMSRNDLAPAYTCGTYHKRGTKGCTSHHTRVDMLDDLLKSYIKKVRDNSAEMIERLQESIAKEQHETKSSQSTVDVIKGQIEDAKAEMKMLTRQQARDVMKHPDRAEIIEETYTEMIDELTLRIEGLKNQMQLAVDKHNTVVRVNRTARTVLEIFDDIINKHSLDKNDLNFIIDKIVVFENRIEIHLKADIDCLLKYGTLTEQQLIVLDIFQCIDVNHLLLLAAVISKVVDRRSLVTESSIRDVHYFDAVHHAKIRKDADLIGVFALEHIFVLVVHSLFVPLVSRRIDRLRITEAVHQEDNIHLLDLRLLKNNRLSIFNRRFPLVAVLFFYLRQIFHNNFRHRVVMI